MSLPVKYFLYARKSTDQEDRQVYSIEHQRAELRKLAADRNLEIVEELEESRSAKAPSRPVFGNILRRIQKGEASGILAWSPDRVARNAIDGGQIIHMLDLEVLRDLQFYTCTYEPTSAGKLMLNVLFGMSKYFSDSLGDGVRRALRQRIQNGYWAKRPPLGYLFDRNIRMVVIDQHKGPLIRKVFECYSTGEFTLDRLTEFVNSLGLVGWRNKRHGPLPLSRSQYHAMLQNPFYTGMMLHNGELYEGKHEPLVSNALFDRCQIMLAQRGLQRQTDLKPFLYRGMFTCGECGCAITLDVKKGHRYLRCTKRKGPCSQAYLSEPDAAKQVAKLVGYLAIPDDAADWMINQFEEQQRAETTSWQQEIKDLQSKITAHDQKLERLTLAFVDGTQSLDSYKKLKDQVLKNKRVLAEKLTFVQNHRHTRFEPAISFIRGLTEARIVAQGNDPVAQRDLLQKAGSNLSIKDGRVIWEARVPWKYVVGLGRFAAATRRCSDASAPAAQKLPGLCTSPSEVRSIFGDLRMFFLERVN